MAKYIYNPTQNSIYYQGREVLSEGYFFIQPNLVNEYATDSQLLSDLALGIVKMSSNGTSPLGGNGSSQIDFLKGDIPPIITSQNNPFTNKVLSNGQKLYTRATGKLYPLSIGGNILDYTITHDNIKFNGIEIDGAKLGETISLQILDTATGTVTTIPNYILNQFGYNINLPNGFYSKKSTYDADLFKDLVIRVIYNAVEARNLGINYMIHEVKS